MRKMISLLGLALVLLIGAGCLSGSIALHRQFIEGHVVAHPSIDRVDLREEDFNLHYRAIGDAREAVLIWIHGTPGGWSDIGRLMADAEFTRDVRVVSIDRPGWGESQFGDRAQVLPDFADQIRLILPLLVELHSQHPDVPMVLAGHSWGAPLVTSLAAQSPVPLAGVLALSGPFDPALSTPRWYNRAARLWIIKALIGSALRRSNTEMYALPGNLASSVPAWQSLQVPVVVVQGESDGLVPYGNFEYARQVFPARTSHFVSLINQGHLLQIERVPMIALCVRSIAQGRSEACTDDRLRDDRAGAPLTAD